MALKPFRSIDYKAFMNGTTYDIGSGSNQERFTSSGEGPVVDGVNLVYWDNLDLIVGEMGEDSTSTKYTTWHDPLVVDVTGPKVKSIARAGVARGFVGGEWNRIAGTQRFYTWGAGGSAGKLIEIEDLVNWSFDTAKASAHTDNIVRDGTNTAIASSTIGFMSNAGTDGASPYGRVFETWGYLLRPGYCKHTDGNTYHGLCLQDITAAGTNPPPGQPTGTSGLGTLIDGGITRYTTTPNNPIDGTEFETGTFLADSFTMAGMQFVPDDDDTPQRPKGFLVLFSKAFDNTGSVTNQWYQYVKFLDFNPFAKSAKPGSPSRIHMRQTLFSRIEYLMNEAPATSANSSGRELVSPPAETLMQYPMYLPNSRKLVTIFDHLIGNDSAGSDIAWVEWGITPEITQIQPPTNITSVKTAKTVQWSGKAVGSIGEGDDVVTPAHLHDPRSSRYIVRCLAFWCYGYRRVPSDRSRHTRG